MDAVSFSAVPQPVNALAVDIRCQFAVEECHMTVAADDNL